jgi:molecular chaperone GrpE
LPVADNLERALAADGSLEDMKKGVEMTLRQFKDSLEKLGVTEIPTDGEFDPNLHDAMMHVEDENYGKNVITEVFQKGYKRGDKVIRYSMVKVAN